MNKCPFYVVISLILVFACRKAETVVEDAPSGPIRIEATVPGEVWENVDTFYLDARRTSTLNGKRPLEFLWSVKEAPPLAAIRLQNAGNDLARVSGPHIPGQYTFELLVREKTNPANESRATYRLEILKDSLYLYPPKADAGGDRTIAVPKWTVELDGIASVKINPERRELAFLWSLISKPAASPDVKFDEVFYSYSRRQKTKVLGLIEGVYQFRLDVTNELGLTGSDTVLVTVLPDPLKGKTLLKENLVWEEFDWPFWGPVAVAVIMDSALVSERGPSNTEVRVWLDSTQIWTGPNDSYWQMYSDGLMYVCHPYAISGLGFDLKDVGKKTKVEIRVR